MSRADVVFVYPLRFLLLRAGAAFFSCSQICTEAMAPAPRVASSAHAEFFFLGVNVTRSLTSRCMKQKVTFSGSSVDDEETAGATDASSQTQAARVIASLESKKLGMEVAHTSKGATGFAELLGQLLSDYAYVPGRPGSWWRANAVGVWKEAIDAPQCVVTDASIAVEAYVRGRLKDRMDRIDTLLAPKLTKELGVVVRQRLLQLVKGHLALRRRLEKDVAFQGEVLSKLEQLVADMEFRDQVNVFAREDAAFLVDPTRCRLEPVRDRRAVLDLKLVLAAPSLEPTEPMEAWIPPDRERWAVFTQVLGFALISGVRPRSHRIRGDVEMPRIIQLVLPKGESDLGTTLALACGSYGITVSAARRSAPSKKSLLGKRIVLIQSLADSEPLSGPRLVRGILNAVSENKSFPAIVVCSADRSPLAVKGQTVLYLDMREALNGPTVRQLQIMLMEGFRSLGEPRPPFETRPELHLDSTMEEAVQEVVRAEVEASGGEPCRPATGARNSDAKITREPLVALVERLEVRAKNLGFLSLTIRQTVVVRCLKALGFSTSNSTNRLFWYYREGS